MPRNLAVWLLVIMSAAWLNLGTIYQDEDPILRTQTNPILYTKKMDEIKDGEKGAPAPSFKFYKREKFYVEEPMEKEAFDPEVFRRPGISPGEDHLAQEYAYEWDSEGENPESGASNEDEGTFSSSPREK